MVTYATTLVFLDPLVTAYAEEGSIGPPDGSELHLHGFGKSEGEQRHLPALVQQATGAETEIEKEAKAS